MTRSQREAFRAVWACVGVVLLVLLCALLASAGCGAPEASDLVTARVVADQSGSDCPGVQPAPFKAALRVMPVGDSTTAGNWGGVSWRAPLLAALNAHPEVQTVTFVGTQSAVAPCCYDAFPGAATAVVMARLPKDIEATKPDVLLVHLGTNDQDPSVVPAYMAGIDAALATPDLVVIAAPVIYWASNDAARLAFNAALVPALKAHPAYGSRLLVAEAMAGAVAPGPDFDQPAVANDGVHPGVVGNAKMAEVWRAAGAGRVWAGGAQ